MKAIVWQKPELSIKEVATPALEDGHSLVKVVKAGICNTDLELIQGYYDYTGILGHEFCGLVTHSNESDLVGKRVAVDINCACESCSACKEQNFQHCQNRKVIGIKDHAGAFAEFVSTPNRNLFELPPNLSDEAAIFIEPLAAAFNIQEQIQFEKSASVCVIGDGKLGLLIAMSLASSELDVTLLGHHPERHERLRFQGKLNYVTEVPTQQFSCVVEATGNPEGFQQAIHLCRPQGHIVLKSTYAGSVSIDFSPIVVNEIKIVGSRCGPFTVAIKALADGKVDPTPLIDKSFPLSDGVSAIEAAQKKGALKIALDMASDSD